MSEDALNRATRINQLRSDREIGDRVYDRAACDRTTRTCPYRKTGRRCEARSSLLRNCAPGYPR
jgi:hypothetical protein